LLVGRHERFPSPMENPTKPNGIRYETRQSVHY
jgi:hypothetical protein